MSENSALEEDTAQRKFIKRCPRLDCGSERPLSEVYCQNLVNGETCNWNLVGVPPTPLGAEPNSYSDGAEPPHVVEPSPDGSLPPEPRCPNGHPTTPGDYLCPTCGEAIVAVSTDAPAMGEAPIPPYQAGEALQDEPEDEAAIRVTEIDGWIAQRRLGGQAGVYDAYLVRHDETGRDAVLRLYEPGAEPDADVYRALQHTDIDHIPELIAFGRHEDRAYEISERIAGGDLSGLRLEPSDRDTLRVVLDEVGRALDSFAEIGLRHRALRPESILIRDPATLDLVISDFSSARLSEFDLDLVSPLETTRYTAPEAVLGGVSAASDWWSLGIILLEKLTDGACFEGVQDQAFLIHMLAHGVSLPDDLDAEVAHLLRGLLVQDRTERWRWDEVKAWLDGTPPPLPFGGTAGPGKEPGPSLTLGGKERRRLADYALAAASAELWDEAREQFRVGALAVWAEDSRLDPKRLAILKRLQARALDDDLRFAIALKALHPEMPLVLRGEIVTPGWLTTRPEAGYALISSEAPEILEQLGAEPWLGALKRREAIVRTRAKNHEIELHEPDLRVYLLATSRANLTALWDARRQLFPDTDHRGLSALVDRPQVTDEDMIILLSASIAQFQSIDDVVRRAEQEARSAGLEAFDAADARFVLEHRRRREVFAYVAERIANFAHCGVPRIDDWADKFRHENRISLSRALVLLSIAEEDWRQPAHQEYLRDLLGFFEQKVALSIKRGPLARMIISRTVARVDLQDLGTGRSTAEAILNAIIDRSTNAREIDPGVFARDPDLEPRLRRLVQQSLAYKRDTGIDGLYIGFPFVLFSPGDGALPRIAPVLLWPVQVTTEARAHGSFRISFDDERAEVRLNPALEAYLSSDALEKWKTAAEEARNRSDARLGDIIDEFGHLALVKSRTLERLPGKDAKAPRDEMRLCCSAVLFHAAFVAQAIMEDLRALRRSSPVDTALETMLRMPSDTNASIPPSVPNPPENERFFTAASDPSQEAAVLSARLGPGLVIEGPPGTGKSQTIVNIVSDSIGRKRSLLLVCQKQAALDVVRKRLISEGLGDRVVMITDVNKDRRTVIQSIREQIEDLRKRQSNVDQIAASRRQLAARIGALESELNRHFEALHFRDSVTGLGYRDLVGQLVELESGDQAPIDCLDLRSVLSGCDRAELETLKEHCAPLGEDWIAAEFETSPFEATRQFSWDPATLRKFDQALADYQTAEDSRHADLGARPPDYGLADLSGEELEDWIVTAQLASARVTFFGALSLSRFRARRRVKARLRTHFRETTEAEIEQFREDAVAERAARAEREARRRSSEQALDALQQWFEEPWLDEARQRIARGIASTKAIAALQAARPTLPAFQRFRARAGALPAKAFEVFAAFRSVTEQLTALPDGALEGEIRRIIDREARLGWLAQIESKRPELLMDQRQLKAKVAALADADRQMRTLNRKLLAEDIDVGRLESAQQWTDITRLQGPRRRSLREFVDLGASIGLFEARPIWLMNPDVACRLLPRDRALFDRVVFDEASQMPVEYALPVLFRGRSAIVSGDEKQLPPTSFFASRVENDEAEMEGADISEDATEQEIEAAEEVWNRREIKDCGDLLALARAALPNRMLEVHYRSQFRELIAFSNAAFYQNRLHVPVQHPEDEVRRAKPVDVIRVDGVYADQRNREEAERIVELLAEQWRASDAPSIGVVTFNRKQADLIDELLDERAEEDLAFRAALTRELARNEGGEDVGFFVKNVENVQGDERDVIIFSTTFGRNPQGTFKRNFGVLGQKGGERRLNVAISRAKQKVILVTSMPVAEVSDLMTSRRPPTIPRDYLQGYLHFAELLSRGDLATAGATLKRVGGRSPRSEGMNGASLEGFAATVAEFIRELGHEPTPLSDGGAFGVDFAIRDPRTGLFGIGIECDAPHHELLLQARAREIWRPELLRRNLSRIHRVSSYAWYYEREHEKSRLAQAVGEALG